MAALHVRELGDFIRDQRSAAHISLRQLAQQAGVSNPYLSQIERGLRKPSAEILQQIAKALRISAEVLYVQAGILEEREGGEDVHAAVLADEVLTARQKQVILDIYDAFRRENAAAEDLTATTVAAEALAQPEVPAEPAVTPAPAKAEPAPTTSRRRASPTSAEPAGGAASKPRAARRPRATSPAGPAETPAKPARRTTTTRRTASRRGTAASTGPDTTKTSARASSDAPGAASAGPAEPAAGQASTSEP